MCSDQTARWLLHARPPTIKAQPDWGLFPWAGSFLRANLTESDTLMLREMARGLDDPGVEDFIARVRRRLDEVEAGGVVITKNHVRAAGTTELAA